ncbi:ABC transporter substrate-binding protein [Paenibacillus doosanensis]|uniref:Siderophore-binding lipoprotein YfiY n=1 Tax=Paenibacillus konkukensis TaxID=2020716 RepID=A0ABY4RHJ6_9BACL|nr:MULTISPECIES: ABC transporter substrate-binding protein [Paenibacillus]MCS7464117.1 ABC transporter substrate-binding protein [Paenibacillus doosanensis]UQZ81326.1 putative siderophore-binding lipoprotein YfiY precursor [Paenibacillus konkukensis]
MKSRTSRIMLCLVIAAMTLGSACGNTGQNAGGTAESSQTNAASGDAQSGSAAPAGERTVTDELGHQVKLPAHIDRVLAPYLEDPIAALGVKPVAQWSSGSTVFEYLQPWLKDVPKTSSTPAVEEVLAYQPDLIILNTAAKAANGIYEQYAKIAPTYVFQNGLTKDWKEVLLTVGELLGSKDKAEQAIAGYEQKAREAKRQISPIVGDKKSVILWIQGKSIYLVDSGRFSGAVLAKDLGFPFPEQALVETVGKPLAELSLETLPDLKADYIFYVNQNANGNEQTNLILDNEVWKRLPAVQQGHAYEVDYGNWINGGILANEKTIDDVLKLLKR